MKFPFILHTEKGLTNAPDFSFLPYLFKGGFPITKLIVDHLIHFEPFAY